MHLTKLATLVVLGLVLAACGAEEGEGEEAAEAEDESAVDDGGDAQVTLTSPEDGAVIEDDRLAFEVDIAGYEPAPQFAGKSLEPAVGHYHVLLDGGLINAFIEKTGEVSMRNLEPGEHELAVVPARHNHSVVSEQREAITFEYAPAEPPEPIEPEDFPDPPQVEIVSHADGDTVPADEMIQLQVEVENLNLSCDLLGKPSVDGYGHLHLHLDEPGMPSLTMMTCEKTIPVMTHTLEPGSTHTFIAVLADNIHQPLEGAMDTVELQIAE